MKSRVLAINVSVMLVAMVLGASALEAQVASRQPVNGSKISSLTPVLKWDISEGAAQYFVGVYTAADAQERIFEKVVKAGSTQVPEGVLQSGKKYWWCVFPSLPSGSEWGPPGPLWSFETPARSASFTNPRDLTAYQYVKANGEYLRDSRLWTGGVFVGVGAVSAVSSLVLSDSNSIMDGRLGLIIGAPLALVGGLTMLVPNPIEQMWLDVESGKTTPWAALKDLADQDRTGRYVGGVVLAVTGGVCAIASFMMPAEARDIMLPYSGFIGGLGAMVMFLKTPTERIYENLQNRQMMSRLIIHPGYDRLSNAFTVNTTLKF